MKKTTVCLIVTLAITLSLLGCNARNVGMEETHLTKKVLFIGAATEISGFATDLGPCVSTYTDINEDPDYLINEYLCHAVEILEDLGVDGRSEEPNKFKKDKRVQRYEMWDVLSGALGFLRYSAVCSQIISLDDPHRYVLGSLCEKGLLAEYEPYEFVTLDEWFDTLSNVRMYLELETTRVAFAEVLVYHFHPNGSELAIEEHCQSLYPDVENDSIECSISRLAAAIQFTGYSDGLFGSDGSMNNAGIVKIIVIASGLPADEETGCFQGVCEAGEEWYCRYLDAACEAGILPDDFPHDVAGISSTPPLKKAFHLVYEAKLFL